MCSTPNGRFLCESEYYSCNTGLCQQVTNGNSEGVSQSCIVITLCVSFLLQLVTHTLMAYLSRLSAIACNKINCGPALTWMEVQNEALVVLCSLTLASRVSRRCALLPFKREINLPDLSLKSSPKSLISSLQVSGWPRKV